MSDRFSTGRARRPWVLRGAAAISLLGYLACLVADYPGHFPFDAVWQLAQGRQGIYNDWHPPVMAWLLGLADRALPGAWLFVAAEGALFYGAVFAFLALESPPRAACLPILLLWMVSPLALIYQGVALKDVLFADAGVAGFAALAWAFRPGPGARPRVVLLSIALPMFVLATLTRQNGFVVAVVGALSVSGMLWSRGAPGARRAAHLARALAAGGLALGLVVGISFAATEVFDAYGDHEPENAHHAKVLQVFDLAGALHRDPSFDLGLIGARQPALGAFIRRSAKRYSPVGVDNITTMPGADDIINSPDNGAGATWAGLIAHRPWLYVSLRAQVWWHTLMTPAKDSCPAILVGVDRPADSILRKSGLRPRESEKDDWDGDYAAAFLGTPLFSHAFYLVVIVVVLSLQARRWLRREWEPRDVACVGLCLAALAFTASFFVISIDCDYRFLYFLDVAAMAASVQEAARRGPARDVL